MNYILELRIILAIDAGAPVYAATLATMTPEAKAIFDIGKPEAVTPAVRDPSTLVLSYHVRLTLGLSAASNVMSGNCFVFFN